MLSPVRPPSRHGKALVVNCCVTCIFHTFLITAVQNLPHSPAFRPPEGHFFRAASGDEADCPQIEMAMTIRFCRRALGILLLTCAALPAGAQITYTSIAHPLAGPGGTTAYDVDGSRVVGTYLDAAGASHAFLYDNGAFTTLDHPDAALPRGTSAYGISGNLISGAFVNSSGQTFGFLYDGSDWTTLAHPPGGGARTDTFARGVSGDTVVGYYIESAATRGFVYENGAFRDLVVPGATGTFPDDIDGERIVGTFDNVAGTHAFIADDSLFQTLDHPLGTILGTFGTGVDGANVAGYYLSLPDGSARGFLFDGSGFTAIDYPGATDTTVHGIDDGRIVGSYVDAAGVTRGFIAVVPEPATLALLAPCFLLTLRRPRRA